METKKQLNPEQRKRKSYLQFLNRRLKKATVNGQISDSVAQNIEMLAKIRFFGTI